MTENRKPLTIPTIAECLADPASFVAGMTETSGSHRSEKPDKGIHRGDTVILKTLPRVVSVVDEILPSGRLLLATRDKSNGTQSYTVAYPHEVASVDHVGTEPIDMRAESESINKSEDRPK